MEIVISLFIGCWLAAGGILSYIRIKKDFEMEREEQ